MRGGCSSDVWSAFGKGVQSFILINWIELISISSETLESKDHLGLHAAFCPSTLKELP